MIPSMVFEHVNKVYPSMSRTYLLGEGMKAIRRLAGRGGSRTEDRTVLQDISFEVAKGETVGVIGRNGSGKSTLLRLTCEIERPTSGRVVLNGRVGTLLELGAGFHPDLTGRENVLVNGMLLGFSRSRLESLSDAIVEFAELAPFMDQPLRTFSSGMMVRLGFSIAVHTDPDVLVVDEVLAVGDESFQRKCFEKIRSFQSQGKTLVIVSHNLGLIRLLCGRVLWLDEGKLRRVGPPSEVVEAYVQEATRSARGTGGTGGAVPSVRRPSTGRPGDLPQDQPLEAEILSVTLMNGEGVPQEAYVTGETIVVRMRYRARRTINRPLFGLAIYRSDGISCHGTSNWVVDHAPASIEGTGFVECRFERVMLLEGEYVLSAHLYGEQGVIPHDIHDMRYPLRMVRSVSERSRLPHVPIGVVAIEQKWTYGRSVEP